MQRIETYLASALVLLASSTLPCIHQVAFANDGEPAEVVAIDSREQELMRKEQELLKAMQFNSTDSPAVPAAQPESHNATSEGAAANGVTVLEIKAPEQAPVVEQLGNVQEPAPMVEKHSALQELEHHPALIPPRKVAPPPPTTSNRVRTKSYDDSPDGTTARRVGSFYRIDRDNGDATSFGGVAHARTVPIQDMSPVSAGRPALLTSEELATIRNASTYLRTGPTRLDSALLKVPQYTEVTIDHRSGTWYRVKTENGVRGWVPGSALLFDADVPAHSAVRIGGVR